MSRVLRRSIAWRRSRRALAAALAAASVFGQTSARAQAPARSETALRWGGFVDAQYAFDFNEPSNGDRSYTTQPARANEFGVNLAFVEAVVEAPQRRARVALQAGSSVQANYAAEPRRGAGSGGDLSRHLQEARAGYRIDDATWIDAGVFFAPTGAETWISRDNLTLTRSLVADYSPYYLAGIKATRDLGDGWTAQAMAVNGWQNVSENNSDKAAVVGIERAWERASVGYVAFVGREVSPDLGGRPRDGAFRHFHDLVIRSRGEGRLEWIVQADMGFQNRPEGGASGWWGAAVLARYALDPQGVHRVSWRAETYRDPDQILVVTGRADPLRAWGASIGYDRALDAGLLLRLELRGLMADAEAFRKGGSGWSRENAVAATSVSATF